MKKHNGFVSVVAALLILALGSAAILGYTNRKLSESQIQLKEAQDRMNDLEEGLTNLGGSVVASRYGGTGTSSAAWTGLVRVATGTWSTTTLTDADVPDTITVTTLPNSVTFNTSTITNLFAGTTTAASTTILNLGVTGTSTFKGTSTFSVVPTTATSDSAVLTNLASIYFSMANFFGNYASYATSSSNANVAATQVASNTLIIMVAEETTSGDNFKIEVGPASSTELFFKQCYENTDAVGFSGCTAYIPAGWYYKITVTDNPVVSRTIITFKN